VSLARYALIVLGSLAASQAGTWLALGRHRSPDVIWAVFMGGGLAALNTLAAYGLVLWSEQRSTQTLMAAVLGGMLGRMALLLTAMVAAIVFGGLPKLPLVASLLTYFVAFLVFELALLHRRTSATAPSR